MSKVIIVVESGSDVTQQEARELGMFIVPMYVNMDGKEIRDDGSVAPEEVRNYYDRTKKVPKTAGCSVADFDVVFDDIHEKNPEAIILYIAYSGVTTCSYQSATISAETRDYVIVVDSKNVTVGQGAVAKKMREWCDANPEATMDEIKAQALDYVDRMELFFLPDNLDYLRAGGRVSNAKTIMANLLHLHPRIDIEDGRLIAKKKYRGSLDKVVPKVMDDFNEMHDFDKDEIWLVYTTGFPDELRGVCEEKAKEMGFKKLSWTKCGCVITTHGGPSAFGMCALRK